MDWSECSTPQVDSLIALLRSETVGPKEAFVALESFLDTASNEDGYRLMVQIRLRLAGLVSEENGFSRKLDTIANQGVQSATYIKAMQRIFGYIEKENKKLPTPPV